MRPGGFRTKSTRDIYEKGSLKRHGLGGSEENRALKPSWRGNERVGGLHALLIAWRGAQGID